MNHEKKWGVILTAVSICVAFTLGYSICYFQFSYRLHTKTFLHANGKVAREVTYKSNVDAIFSDELKHGVETTFDENGEWKGS